MPCPKRHSPPVTIFGSYVKPLLKPSTLLSPYVKIDEQDVIDRFECWVLPSCFDASALATNESGLAFVVVQIVSSLVFRRFFIGARNLRNCPIRRLLKVLMWEIEKRNFVSRCSIVRNAWRYLSRYIFAILTKKIIKNSDRRGEILSCYWIILSLGLNDQYDFADNGIYGEGEEKPLSWI